MTRTVSRPLKTPPELLMNPLSIPSILGNVLEYLPVNDIKTSRLVSHQWAEEGGKLLTKWTNVVFLEEDSVKRFLTEEMLKRCKLKQDVLSSGEQMGLLSSARHTHFKFRLHDKWNDYHYTIKSPQCRTFFNEMGNAVVSLDLRRGVWKPEEIDDDFFAKLSNLECFKLDGKVPTPEDATKVFNLDVIPSPKVRIFDLCLIPCDHSTFARSFFDSLLKRMPNLTKIKGSLISSDITTEMVTWITSAPIALRYLSQLDVRMDLNESEVDLLRQKNFPLTDLEMSINPGIRFPGLWRFFSSLGSTLENLKLNLRLRPNQPDSFPCSQDMKRLKKLSLRCFDGPLNFVQNLEKLESLELEDSDLSSGFRDECEPHSSLKSFKTLNCTSCAGRFAFDNLYKNIAKFFPHLRVLRMDFLTDAALRIIFDRLTNLEEFIALQGIYTDEGMIGLLPHQIDTTRSTSNYVVTKKDTEAGSSQETEVIRKPNLTNLKNLRVLAVDSPRLTDASVKYAIISCKEIKSLVLESPNITDGAVRAIVNDMDLYYLQFRSEYQVSRKMVHYARGKMKGNGRLIFFSNSIVINETGSNAGCGGSISTVNALDS